jgi:cytochrome c oxidase cbb3-type subunit 3
MTEPGKTAYDEGVVHVYDDIRECDNKLPNWWLYTLFGAMAFALVYWVYYHEYRAGTLPVQAYKRELIAARKAEAQRMLAMGEVTDDKLEEMGANPALVQQGKDIFVTSCAPCHQASGGGQIGPNLTDEFWIHGGKPTDILRTVRDGVVEKGMVAWGPQLGEDKVRAVTAYVLSIRNTHVPGGKPPQGEKVASR